MLYFAYGSNMDEPQMKNRCPESSLVGVAVLDGYCLGYTRYAESRSGGVADIVSAPGSSVWGLVYTVTVKDLELLDNYEGKAYARMKVNVKLLDGRTVEAEVYYVITKQDYTKPSDEYRGILLKAARKHRFPEEYIAQNIMRER